MDKKLVEKLQEQMPPLFAAVKLDELTHGLLKWRTIQNMRSEGKKKNKEIISEKCFITPTPRKVLIVRDELLTWWLERQNLKKGKQQR